MEPILDVLRKEKKYLISQITAENLYQLFSQVLPLDKNSGYEGYMVRSLYFDTIDDTDFFEKEDGLLNRKKIRLRIYSVKSTTAKLELKEKSGENQRKRSLTITREQAVRIAERNYECLLEIEDSLAHELYFIMTEQVYLPKCVVEYRRVAFCIPENDIRITLDSKLTASESNLNLWDLNLNLYPVSNFDDVTMEVKYNRFLLSYIKDLINSCNKTQLSVSKYILGRSISRYSI